MPIDKLKSRFFTGAWLTDVKQYFSKINEIIDWINNSVTSIGIGGSGTTNYVSKFTATGTIGNSQIFDNTTNVGIGTISPTSKLHILGIDSTSSNFALKVDNSASAILLSVRNDGFITINGNTLGAAKLEINGGSYQGIYSNSNVIGLNGVGLANGSIGTACSVQPGFAGTSLFIRSHDVSNKLIDIVNSSTNSISRMLDSGYFGIGTISPTAMIHSKGTDTTSSNFALKIDNSTSNPLFYVRNDGVVIANNLPTSATGLPAGAIWRNGNVLNIV